MRLVSAARRCRNAFLEQVVRRRPLGLQVTACAAQKCPESIDNSPYLDQSHAVWLSRSSGRSFAAHADAAAFYLYRGDTSTLQQKMQTRSQTSMRVAHLAAEPLDSCQRRFLQFESSKAYSPARFLNYRWMLSLRVLHDHRI